MADQKPLFIPLKAEYFDQFERGDKTIEFRPYGPRWNEKTCVPGRALVLSRGYGKHRRLYGVVDSFERSAEPTASEAWKKCYGNDRGDAACIGVKIAENHGR